MLKDRFEYKQLSHDNRKYCSLDVSFSFDDYDWSDTGITFEEYWLNNDKFATALILLNEMRNYNLYDLNWELFDELIDTFHFEEISPGERPYGISDFIFEKHVEDNGKLQIYEIILPSLKDVFDEIPEEVKEYYCIVSPDLTENTFSEK